MTKIGNAGRMAGMGAEEECASDTGSLGHGEVQRGGMPAGCMNVGTGDQGWGQSSDHHQCIESSRSQGLGLKIT